MDPESEMPPMGADHRGLLWRQKWGRPPRAAQLSGWALLPLRAFLGATFVFAGLQKLANPRFFDTTNPVGIHAQVIAAVRISPLHAVLSHLVSASTLIGVAIAIGEVAVGLGTLAGLWTRTAAVGGLILSITLFLTVSYHASPYYTGADIVFAVAWIALVVAGPSGVWSLDAWLQGKRGGTESSSTPVAVAFAAVRSVCGSYSDGSCAAQDGQPCQPAGCPWLVANGAGRLAAAPVGGPVESRRRLVLAAGVTAGLGVVGGGVAGAAAILGRVANGATGPSTGDQAVLSAPTTAPNSPSTTVTVGPTPAAPTTTSTVPRPAGTAIGPASGVRVGGSASFNDPASGDPGLVLQPTAGSFIAFDAVCPHAGCTVAYQPSAHLIVCPCHGSEFNPDSGAVVQGPATRSLRSIKIAEANGTLYVDG